MYMHTAYLKAEKIWTQSAPCMAPRNLRHTYSLSHIQNCIRNCMYTYTYWLRTDAWLLHGKGRPAKKSWEAAWFDALNPELDREAVPLGGPVL